MKIIRETISTLFWVYIIAACLSFFAGSAFVLYYLHHDPAMVQTLLDIISQQ